MTFRRTTGALVAQILAQILTAWALVVHVAGWPEVSMWVVVFLVAAALCPFRHDGSFRDRAAGNFGAATVVAGFLWWDVLTSGFDSIFGGGFSVGAEAMLMLTSAVLFSLAGALFWTMPGAGGAE